MPFKSRVTRRFIIIITLVVFKVHEYGFKTLWKQQITAVYEINSTSLPYWRQRSQGNDPQSTTIVRLVFKLDENNFINSTKRYVRFMFDLTTRHATELSGSLIKRTNWIDKNERRTSKRERERERSITSDVTGNVQWIDRTKFVAVRSGWPRRNDVITQLNNRSPGWREHSSSSSSSRQLVLVRSLGSSGGLMIGVSLTSAAQAITPP